MEVIDSHGDGKPFLNGARDAGWMPLPVWKPIPRAQ